MPGDSCCARGRRAETADVAVNYRVAASGDADHDEADIVKRARVRSRKPPSSTTG